VFWGWLSRLWRGWPDALVFVQPRTVIAWQRQRVRDQWRRLSEQGTPGCPAVAKEIRALIQDMWQANPTWGLPRIVGELRKLGIDVAKSTVETYRVRPQKPPSLTWKTFLHNHVKDLIALDFFVVPTVTHNVLFVLLIQAHERRRMVHFNIFNITEHPTAPWTAQQVVDAFPWGEAPRYLRRDRDRIYRRLVSAAGATHGHRRRADCHTESVAEPLRRTAHREYSPRMPGPRDRPVRATSAAAPDRVRPV
jgi:putative transposase